MESWRYDSVTTSDALPMGITDYGNSVVFASQNAISIENQRFEEMYFPHVVSSSLFNPVMVATHNAFLEENESSSKKLDSFFESNCKVSRQFECNFDKNVDQENLINFSSSKITKNLSSSEAFMPTKPTPIPVFGSSTPFCQVHGCNKKLTSCKDYHKRHKVCEMHSKSAKVIVNGIQQRFCQQCSRFHVLTEFDNGKRSCRRRLADHNQRRRKPHGNTRDDPAITNSKTKGSTRPRATSSTTWHIELEDETINDLRSMSSMTDVQLQYSSLHGSNSAFCPFINKDQTDDIHTNDPTHAHSFLPSQSDSASSCHSSRNPQMKPSIHNVRRTNNMNNLLVGSESKNHETQVWSDDESTIDLLQLSSELMRVEHQKVIIHMKCAHEWC